MGKYYGITRISEKDSLAHYGILGQKWGVRRFQNPDGTLTDAGKKRYGSSLDEVKSNMEKAQKRETQLRRKSEKINSKLLFTTDFSKAHARKKAAKASKEAAEIEGVYERMKNGNATSYVSDFSKDAYASSADKKLQKKIGDILEKSDDPDISSAKRLTSDYIQAVNDLNEAFPKYSRQLSKDTGKPWDGDGSEEHYALQKRYPEYKALSEKWEKMKDDFIEKIIEISKKPQFESIREFDKYRNFKLDLSDHGWYQEGNNKAYAIAAVLTEKLKYVDLFPDDFIEAFHNDGRKIQGFHAQ